MLFLSFWCAFDWRFDYIFVVAVLIWFSFVIKFIVFGVFLNRCCNCVNKNLEQKMQSEWLERVWEPRGL